MAQLGSALRSGRRGPGFKSRLPDHFHSSTRVRPRPVKPTSSRKLSIACGQVVGQRNVFVRVVVFRLVVIAAVIVIVASILWLWLDRRLVAFGG